jgi:hypothetical protein
MKFKSIDFDVNRLFIISADKIFGNKSFDLNKIDNPSKVYTIEQIISLQIEDEEISERLKVAQTMNYHVKV